jgi:hypothetical protein
MPLQSGRSIGAYITSVDVSKCKAGSDYKRHSRQQQQQQQQQQQSECSTTSIRRLTV